MNAPIAARNEATRLKPLGASERATPGKSPFPESFTGFEGMAGQMLLVWRMTHTTTLSAFHLPVRNHPISGSRTGQPTKPGSSRRAQRMSRAVSRENLAPRTQPTMMRRLVQLPEHSPHVLLIFSATGLDKLEPSPRPSMPEPAGCEGASDLYHRRPVTAIGIMETRG